ncbi:MAG: MYXO-CTERM sorting domain-containing protein, partial [Sorangiineae bacterium]|nr:MYXO-CTERM sorting domain-containing protein [Sorangiineae bacterium]
GTGGTAGSGTAGSGAGGNGTGGTAGSGTGGLSSGGSPGAVDGGPDAGDVFARDPGGCSCRASGSEPANGAGWLGVALGALLMTRRRRRAA